MVNDSPDSDLVNDPTDCLTDIDGASVSAFAKELEGDVLASHDPDSALPPASNTKLVTTALALDVLGPEYTFETRVTGHGRLRDGRLDGDLVLDGSGNPDLARDDVAQLAVSVAEPIDELGGDVVLDGSTFAGRHCGPGRTVGDQRHAYGAGSSALALEENVVEIQLSDAAPSEPRDFEVRVVPDSEAVVVETDVQSGEGDLRAFTDPDAGVIRVEGELPTGSRRTERVPVPDPEYHCGAVFRDALVEAGVTVEGGLQRTAMASDLNSAEMASDSDSAETASHPDSIAFSRSVTSETVSALLFRMNHPSNNFIADQLARHVASKHGDGSWEAWKRTVSDFLTEWNAGPCRITDGSGLSRYNLLTARGLVALLEQAAREPWAEHFFDSLPEPGAGTLSSRLHDVSGLRAKTGTLTGSSALSGVVRREESPPVVFSVLFGGLTVEADPARERQDEFVRALARL